jgi:hypothetical protein
VVTEVGELCVLLLGESVASAFLVAEEDAQLHGGAVFEVLGVPARDDGFSFACDVLGECL